MSFGRSLRSRIAFGAFCYATVVAIAVAAHGYVVNERAEHLVWESLLARELAHFSERKAADSSYRWTDSGALRLYGPSGAAAVPDELAALPPGVHDEIRIGDALYVVLVRPPDMLALDIGDFEQNEQALTLAMAASTLAVVAVLALLAYAGAGWLVRPLSSMADALASFASHKHAQRIAVPERGPREAEVIAAAVNDYLRRIDEFVERERAFLNMASHELRTPIAVIAGAAEVALGGRGTDAAAARQLERIQRTARDMERLVALLAALAKDPARLRAAAEPVDLARLVPAIVADHAFLGAGKELSLSVDAESGATILAPAPVARAAIGNLVRNAIENSDRGMIRVAVAADRVTIDDPGHGMSPEEMSALYTRLAREGETGAGIGIELVGRLCEHLGWRLTLSSERGKGTRAVLVFGAAAQRAGDGSAVPAASRAA